MLEIINSDTYARTRDVKNKLCSMNVTHFNKSIEEMLTYKEDSCTIIIAEGKSTIILLLTS